jgi:hypothetical protein
MVPRKVLAILEKMCGKMAYGSLPVFDSSRVCSSGWATNFLVLSPDPITLNQNASPNTLTHTPLGDKWGGPAMHFAKSL